MDLKDKTVVVTGAAGGIGQVLIQALADRQARPVALDKDSRALEKLTGDQKGLSARAVDLTDSQACRQTITKVQQDLGDIHALVNCAGAICNLPLVGLTTEGVRPHPTDQWDRAIATNLSQVFYITVPVAELMVRQRIAGVIVNVSSVSAEGNAGQGAYSAAKAGVRALTAAWAKELAPMRIRVACISPGFTDTQAVKNSMDEDSLRAVRQKTCLRRMAKPKEIVEGILFLLQNDFFDGRTLELDGGLRL